MTEYSLIDLESAIGTFTITVFSEYAGLTIPTRQTVKNIGETTETNQREVGVSELSTLQLELTDDHATYDEGFWYKVLNGDCHIRINLTEGVSETPYFYGIPQEENTVSEDHSLYNSTYIRTHSITLLSRGIELFDTLTEDWIDEVVLNKVDTTIAATTPIATTISLRGFFAALLKVSDLTASYDPTSVEFIHDASNPDVKWKISTTVYTFLDLYVPIDYNNGAADTLSDYYDSTKVVYLPSQYPFAKDLLTALCFTLGLTLRVANTPTASPTAGFTMQLVQKGGRAYSGTLTLTTPKRSTWSKSYDLLGDAVRFTKTHDAAKYVWRSKSWAGTGQENFSNLEPPNTVEFDIDKRFIFEVNGSPAAGNSWPLYAGATGGDLSLLVPLDGVEVWSYATDEYLTPSITNPMGDLILEELMTAYEFFKFTTEFAQVVRAYGPMVADAGSGDTHTVLQIMRRNTIADGISSRTFFANKVTKNPGKDEVEIQWLLE